MIWGFLIVKMPSVSYSKLESGGWFQYSSLTTMWLCMFTMFTFFHAPPLSISHFRSCVLALCHHTLDWFKSATPRWQARGVDKAVVKHNFVVFFDRHEYEPEATWCSEHVWSYDHSHIRYNSYTHGTFLGLWLKTNIANNVLRRSVGLMDLIIVPGT